jgi:hypothetical protein
MRLIIAHRSSADDFAEAKRPAAGVRHGFRPPTGMLSVVCPTPALPGTARHRSCRDAFGSRHVICLANHATLAPAQSRRRSAGGRQGRCAAQAVSPWRARGPTGGQVCSLDARLGDGRSVFGLTGTLSGCSATAFSARGTKMKRMGLSVYSCGSPKGGLKCIRELGRPEIMDKNRHCE